MMKFVLSFFAIVGALGLLASPLFHIQRVEATGYQVVSPQVIQHAVADGNIFTFSGRATRQALLENPYIYRVVTSRQFLRRTVTVDVVERPKVAYVHFNDTHYFYIDREGRILEVSTQRQSPLPVVKGLAFSPFVVGEILAIDNPHAFDTIAYLAGLFLTYDLDPDTLTLNVSDPQNLVVNYGNILIYLGPNQHLDAKLRTALSILPSIAHFKPIGGTLHVSHLDEPWFFSLPT